MGIWDVLLFFLIISAITIILLYFFWPRPGNGLPPGVNVNNPNSTVGFGQQCSEQVQCFSGLTCSLDNQGNGTCLKDTGQLCTNKSECISPNTCSGICTLGPYGSLNEFCPCNSGYQCTPTDDGSTLCKGKTGSSCNEDSDCVSLICQNSVCLSKRSPGQTCLPGECTTGYQCSLGFCQFEGVISGQLGAFCVTGFPAPPSTSEYPGCVSPLKCTNSLCSL